jgi:hypothetical protein
MRTISLIAACLAACGEPQAPAPGSGEATQVVPSAGLPSEYTQLRALLCTGPSCSNNNLDVIRHDGRVYLAVRISPDHFASAEARLFVFSSTDERAWSFETLIHLGADLREPRFLSLGGRLFMYFARLGTNSASFEPQGVLWIERKGAADWTAPADFRPGRKYIPWRFVVRDGRAYFSLYENGQHIYDFSGKPMDVELLVSDDGVTWAPADAAHPVVSTGGGSETAFAFDTRGDLYAVIRNEAGDQTGWGSKICRARKGALGDWACKHDPKKYDSPLVFADGDTIYLVGRRNLTDSGNYQLDANEPWSGPKTADYLIDYSLHPKRCAIWQLDRGELTIRHLADVPGWGDTCFPSALEDPADPRRRVLYNYSSPLDGPDLSWFMGQHGETRIYRTVLTLGAP